MTDHPEDLPPDAEVDAAFAALTAGLAVEPATVEVDPEDVIVWTDGDGDAFGFVYLEEEQPDGSVFPYFMADVNGHRTYLSVPAAEELARFIRSHKRKARRR